MYHSKQDIIQLTIPMKFYTWTLIPAIGLFTSLYFIPEHMNYTVIDWLGGILITCGVVGLLYVIQSKD